MSIQPTQFSPIPFYLERDQKTPQTFDIPPPKYNRLLVLKDLCRRDFKDWNRLQDTIYKIHISSKVIHYQPGIFRKK